MAQHATARTRTAPLHPRRVSGPLRRPLPAGPPTSRTGVFERLSRLPDHRVVDRLLRSRACIWVIGIMLGGIVAMQVSLLRLNAGISRAVTTQTTLVRQNAGMQSRIAELASGERVREAATKAGMVDPPAGETRFLTAHPLTDPARALKRMRPPSAEAEAVMTTGGRAPGATPTATVAGAPGAGAVGTQAQATAATAGAAPIAGAAPTAGSAQTAGAAPIAGTAPTAGATPAPTITPQATPAPTVVPQAAPTVAPQG